MPHIHLVTNNFLKIVNTDWEHPVSSIFCGIFSIKCVNNSHISFNAFYFPFCWKVYLTNFEINLKCNQNLDGILVYNSKYKSRKAIFFFWKKKNDEAYHFSAFTTIVSTFLTRLSSFFNLHLYSPSKVIGSEGIPAIVLHIVYRWRKTRTPATTTWATYTSIIWILVRESVDCGKNNIKKKKKKKKGR